MAKYMRIFDKREYYLYGKLYRGSPPGVKAAVRRLRRAGKLVRLVKYKKDKGKTVLIFVREKEKKIKKDKHPQRKKGGEKHGRSI